MTRPPRPSLLPDIARLHERHPGLTRALAEGYAEAAAVCLHRHHVSPTEFQLHHQDTFRSTSLHFTSPDSRTLRAWGNTDDATRDGAYGMCLAAAETVLHQVAVARADVRTGADYYLGDPSSLEEDLDMENVLRFEVSGVDRGERTKVRQRLRDKVKQARAGCSSLPACAAVVGFQDASVFLAAVGEEE